MSLQSLTTSSFTLHIAFFKKGACQQSAFFLPATLCYEIYNRKIEARQLSNYVTYCNAQMNLDSTVNLSVYFIRL